jgi:hypothetical protein
MNLASLAQCVSQSICKPAVTTGATATRRAGVERNYDRLVAIFGDCL